MELTIIWAEVSNICCGLTIIRERLKVICYELKIIRAKVTIKLIRASWPSRFCLKLTIKALELTIILSRVTIKSGFDDYVG